MSDTPMERLLDAVVWQPMEAWPGDDDLPHATHLGHIHIEGIGSLRVYRLSTGARVIDEVDLRDVFGPWLDAQT